MFSVLPTLRQVSSAHLLIFLNLLLSQGRSCPDSSSSYSDWQADSSRYYEVGADYHCAVRVGGNSVIYHQGGIQRASCNDTRNVPKM